MHRLLIPLLACLFISAPSLLRAQVPHEIHYPAIDPHKVQPSFPHADAPCGNAGTLTFGQFNGFSNDVAPAPIFLCFGDSLLIQHNGDADLSGDPNPASPAGVAYAFYTCPPTVTGPTLQDVIGDALPPISPDPCLLPGAVNGLYITQAVANGGATWFFNSGALQTTFNGGQPLSLFFAPITVDDFANNNYESSQPGFKPGPCVAVNTAAAFEVVYLNEITATGISTNFGNDCLGRFTVRGGYPQYDGNAVYTINISLASDPSVKAIIHTAATQLFHLSSVAFSVPQAGVYNVTIEDGKSCPHSFQMNMSVCNPVDNVMMNFPDTIVPPGGTICVPVTVDNFSILSASFSIEWNENVLQYNGIQNVNSVIDTVFGPANVNANQTNNGLLGVQIFNNTNPTTITIPNGATLFELCFTAVGPLGACSGMGVTNNPTGVAFEDDMGQNLALSVDTGQICVAFLPLDFGFAVIDTTCLGQATLTVTPVGGVEPYDITVMETTPAGPGPTYSGSVSNSGNTFTVPTIGSSNNTPYSYTICVVDNNGLGASQCTTIVVDIHRLGAQINFAQQPLCNGLTNGIINAVVLEGGVIVNNPGPNYTFAWSPATVPNPTSQVQNGVKAGLYTVTVTNTTTGCSEVASGTLGQPAPLSSQSVTTIPAACSGVANGSITYEAEGGTPFAGGTYQFAWTYENTNTPVGTPGTANPITLNGAASGEYRIKITDANGCMFIDSNLVLTDLRALSISQNAVQNVLCKGQSNGSIAITVVESVMTNNPYTFTWSPAGFTQLNNTPSSTYSNLPVGSYIVKAVDNLGCQISDTIAITEPQALVLDTLAIANPICSQPNSGSICVITFGGTGSPATYQYAWSNAGTGNCQSGLPFGAYTVTVTDQNMCTNSLSFNLPQPSPPNGSVAVTALKCGNDGALTANYPTGVIFVWKDANGIVIDSTATIDTLVGGDYVLNVYDGGGCLALDTISLANVIPLSFSDTTLQMPSCFGLKDGKIAIGVQDGQPPYVNYQWNPAQTPSGPVIFNLGTGTYAVTVTDNAGCTVAGSFQLGQPPEIVLTFDPTVNGRVSCFGSCDGKATPLVVYNAPQSAGDFNFLWENGSTDSTRIDLCAGLNSLTVTDGNGCYDIESVFISSPTEVGFSALNTVTTKCFGDSTGSASITASGGNGGPYSYLWNTGATTNSISGVKAGVYTVTLTDKNGCSHSIDTINILEPAPMVLSTTTQPLSCFGGDNGQAKVITVGGIPGYTYNWEDATGDNVGTAQIAEMLKAGTYSVTVTDANNCTASTSATLQDPLPVVGTYEPLAALNCNGDETILKILNISGGAGAPFKFSVDFGAVLDPSFPVSLGGGQHFLTYYDVLDCATTVPLDIPEPAPITVTFDPNVIEVELGATADLEPIITGAPVIASFTWTNPQALLNADTLSATAYTFTNLTYTLTVVDSAGCSGTGSVTVNIDPNRNVYIPNAFVPANASGLNDHFNIYTGLGVEMVNFLRVYDRWGDLMYERERFLPDVDNLSQGWDGRYNGNFVNPGVFVYLAEVKFLDGRVLLYRGDVTVIR